MVVDIDTDTLLERLRQRIDPSEYDRGYCASCEAHLTSVDIEQGACSNCEASIGGDDESGDPRESLDDEL
jgi:hypothetical protein